jgi:ketosteroid isomerase-like protein
MSSQPPPSPSPQSGRDVVERYLDRIVAHDWAALSDCVAADVVRVGPFGDTYSGKGDYLAFLSGLMPTLEGYSMRVDRIVAEARFAVAELTETVEFDGTPIETPEALVFDLDGDGRICHIAIYIQRHEGPPTRPPV